MTPNERAELIRRKQAKQDKPVLSESAEPLPEEPAIKPKRTRKAK